MSALQGKAAAEMRAWAEATAGSAISDVRPIPGGASRQSFVLTFADGNLVFLRSDHGGGPMSGTIFTLQREARLLKALAGSAVKVPRIHAVSSDPDAILMDCVPGSSNYGDLEDPSARRHIERELINQLAALHGLDVDVAAAFGGEGAPSIGEAIRADLAVWRTLFHREVSTPDPILLFALDWLDRHAPSDDRRPVIVHGDIGPGNFMFDQSGITALIDWEIAHAGHPLEDIACIIARTLGVPFGTPESLVGDYAAATGAPVDRHELRYCLILVLVRFSIGIAMAIARGGPLLDLPTLIKFRQVNLHALTRLLMAAEGLETPPQERPADARQDGETAMLYEYSIHIVANGADGEDDAFKAHRMRGVADLLRYLRDMALEAPAGANADAMSATEFNARIASADDATRRDMLTDLFALSQRRHRLMRHALGPMFDRRIAI